MSKVRRRKKGEGRESLGTSGEVQQVETSSKIFGENRNFRPGRESRFNRAESEKVVQGSRQTGGMQSVTSRPPLPDCKTCGKKHTGICLKGEKKCFKCGKEGHFAVQCPGGSSGPKPSFTCFKCGKPGHIARDCKAPGPAIHLDKAGLHLTKHQWRGLSI